MDGIRNAVRACVLVVAGLFVLLLVLQAKQQDPTVPPQALADASGAPFAVPTQPGATHATFDGKPVLVIVAPASVLEGVETARGAGQATPSLPVPGHPELRMFALSAKSTFLGCTVGWNAGLGGSKDIEDYDGDGVPDGRILDPCHQGQWDAFWRGHPQPGSPAPTALAVLDVRIVEGVLVGYGFDGPVGATR